MTEHDLLLSLVSFGLTQDQIKNGTGINQPTISRTLNNKQKKLSFTHGKRLEDFYRSQLAIRKAA